MPTPPQQRQAAIAAYTEQRRMALDAAPGVLPQVFSQHTPSPLMRVGDSAEALSFVVAQLAHTEATVFAKQYTPMQYEELLPLSYEAGEYATEIRYEIMDAVGATRSGSGKGAVNLVDVAYADKTFPVVADNIGYDYTQEELRQTAYLRRPISSARMDAAMDIYRRKLNAVGLFGDTQRNLTGLFNNPYVPQASAPTGNWAAATPDQILADINTALLAVWNNSANNDHADTLALAPSAYSQLLRPRATNSDMTLLRFVQENNLTTQRTGRPLKIAPAYGLDTAGVGGTKRLMAYVRSPLRLVMHVPLPLRFLAPQFVGLSVQVPGEFKYSGVENRYIKSSYYMDGL
ncbi:DUF2184 domain-containing protein [Methylomagnum ishizawai]|uniref:DUF2184 domain-containing protein n=1 Tax=Methylomagnum ishizawai TaxID=1760988 RepID=UPI001C335AF6|nr:major capsid family protein [Methylomagnum ishizawai]BBL73203.1 hypothetical protein MishRS11D_03010 [Methylomagnum ishizawai]